ncbi:hypothetical protein KM043_005042 [Ampulex compressa]|nr:hypothetical protein KM043_005042 [Ampulex compressa]
MGDSGRLGSSSIDPKSMAPIPSGGLRGASQPWRCTFPRRACPPLDSARPPGTTRIPSQLPETKYASIYVQITGRPSNRIYREQFRGRNLVSEIGMYPAAELAAAAGRK